MQQPNVVLLKSAISESLLTEQQRTTLKVRYPCLLGLSTNSCYSELIVKKFRNVNKGRDTLKIPDVKKVQRQYV